MDIGKSLQENLPEGWEFTEKDLALISLAQATAGTIARLELELEDSDIIELGSRKQKRVSPLVAELRFQRESLAKILDRVQLPDEETKSARHQRAAQARWERHA